MPEHLKISDDELAAVSALTPERRYGYFVKRVVDWEEAWGIGDDDGWCSMKDSSGTRLLPLWPARRYAEQYLTGEWSSARTRKVLFGKLMEWLPTLESDGYRVAVFPVPDDDTSLQPEPHRLVTDLRMERQKYP